MRRLARDKRSLCSIWKERSEMRGQRCWSSWPRAKLKVSKQKVGSASPEKKASKLSQIKGVVKKVGLQKLVENSR